MKKLSKRGAEMTIGTIVLIILALVVLVVLIFGFSTGWSNLWNNIIGFGGGQVNVQTVVQACQVACSTSSTYDYCTRERNVVFEKANGKDNELNGNYKCNEIERVNGAGLERCQNIDCGAGVEQGLCSGTPNPLCSEQSNKGMENCENNADLAGCKWNDNENSDDDNIGTCEVDTSVKCPDYNNDKSTCEKLKCTWTAEV